MSKAEAKVSREGGWQAIDIFLFTNGQQYSPPRKYHLKADELNRWDSTIKYLAKTHCGSLHKIIDLYTLCGIKIDGPLDLRDGTPYVAVTPPDEFKHSGYERYLVKASRSWEKQQAKRKSMELTEEKPQVSGPAHIGVPYVNPCMLSNVSELNTIKMPNDSFAVESGRDMLVKPKKMSKSVQQQPRKSIISTTPRSEKRRSTIQNTAFMKTPNSREQSTNNSIGKNKETFHRRTLTKIPLKINVPGNELAAKMKKIINKTAPSEIFIPPRQMSPIPSGLLTSPPTQSDVKTILSINKSLLTESFSIPNVIVDKEIVVMSEVNNLYQNPNSGTKSMMLETCHLPMVDEVTSCNITGVDGAAQTQIGLATEETNTPTKALSTTPSKVKVFPVTVHKQDNSINCNFPVDDNYIALINKGNAVNMNLHIELQNGETNPESQRSTNTEMHKVSSLTDLFKRKSQSCCVEETILQTNSLQSITSGVNDTFAKVMIVQCGCCGNNITVPKVDTMPVYKDDKGFFILIPVPAQTEIPRCPCAQNDDSICDKKAKAELFIRDICRPTPDTVYPCMTRQVGMIMTMIDSTGSQTDKYPNNACELYMRTHEIKCTNEDKCTVENCGTICDDFLPVEHTPVYNLQDVPKSLMESYTQTEWCRVLLEVKCHEDGRYSFHLPSLSVLRKCSR